MTAVRVLTVDDQDIFLRVAADVIEATPGFEAVGQAASGAEALEAVRRLDPQLERDELPYAALTMNVPVVRKRDFGPRLLRRLWSDHGRR